MATKTLKTQVKKFTKFRPQIYSRHPTHQPLRTELGLLPFRSVVRFGSTTVARDAVSNGGNRIECNTIQAVKNSASKFLMKKRFTEANVKSADWWNYDNDEGHAGFFKANNPREFISLNNIDQLPFPIVAKHIYGSRGTGNALLSTQDELTAWLQGKTLTNYIFEKFHNYSREYRLHVTADGCFYTCRKLIKEETPVKDRWFRNDSNSTWIVENNASFDKPVNWDAVIAESVKALNAVGLDVGAIDLKIQSAKDSRGAVRKNPEFIVIEINSAPSHGKITTQKYLQEIPKILTKKYTATK